MFTSAPANNAYLELIGETFVADIVTRNGLNNVRTMEVLLDIMLLNTDDPGTSDSSLFGQESFWWFYFDQASPSQIENLRFFTTRNSTSEVAYPDNLDFGKRYVIRGKDDGTNISIAVNGVEESAALQGTLVPISIDSEPIRLGADAVYHTALRLYECWVKVNGQTVIHIRPKPYMGATLPDLTTFGNDMAITGTANTDYNYGPTWNREPAFAGKDTLS